MDPRRISDALSVSPQIGLDDLAAIAALGFRSVICNRPDGEAADQQTFEEVEAAAAAVGLQAAYLPVTPGRVRDADAVMPSQ